MKAFKRTSDRRRILLGVNVALLAGLAASQWAVMPGFAQDAGRGRGSYLMIGGEIQGGNANAIYVLDTANQEMIVLRWNPGRGVVEGLGYRDLRRDSAQEGGR